MTSVDACNCEGPIDSTERTHQRMAQDAWTTRLAETERGMRGRGPGAGGRPDLTITALIGILTRRFGRRVRMSVVRGELRDLLNGFEPVSLEALDERAALLRRTDNKYAVSSSNFAELLERLRRDHQVLEIDGRRVFRYSTVYFDTPDLRCFVDHVEDRVPRFKARSRVYEDTGVCVFEVKLKRQGDETDKRQIDYAKDDRRRLTQPALDCLGGALAGVGLETREALAARLTTRFERVTLAAREGAERLTCDLRVRLTGEDDRTVEMDRDLILVESKSENGSSPADRELAGMSVAGISLSKYRVGMSLVGGAHGFGPQPGGELFQ